MKSMKVLWKWILQQVKMRRKMKMRKMEMMMMMMNEMMMMMMMMMKFQMAIDLVKQILDFQHLNGN